MEPALTTPAPDTPSDEELARRVLAGERALYELLMRRHNQRVYRCVRSLIRDEAEVEEVMQQTYVSAYLHLAGFQGASRFSTWLTRIAINEALMRLRRARRFVALDGGGSPEAPLEDPLEDPLSRQPAPGFSPEEEAARHELRRILQQEVDALPDLYRTVFVLREVEGLSTADTAVALDTNEEVVKTRLHRARAALRERLSERTGALAGGLFEFHAARCDRVVHGVMARLHGP